MYIRHVPLGDGRTLSLLLQPDPDAASSELQLSVGAAEDGSDDQTVDLPPEALPALVHALLALAGDVVLAGGPTALLGPLPELLSARWRLDRWLKGEVSNG